MLSLNKNKFYEIYPDWSKDVYKNNNINKFLDLGSLIHESDIINHFLKNDTTNCKYSCLPDNFSIDVYKYYNFDLLNFSDNQLIAHYIQSGKAEKRIATIDDFYRINPNFDRLFYVKLYGDLKNLNTHNLIKHYLYFGREEKRLTGPKDFYEKNPNFNRSITNTDFIVNYIINNKESIKDKLKCLPNNSFTEEQFYEKFNDWNYDIYKTFNTNTNTINVDFPLDCMNDFVAKLNLNIKSKLNLIKNPSKKIIYSLNTFYEVFNNFNYKKYRHDNYIKFIDFSEVQVITYWYTNDYNNTTYNSKSCQTDDNYIGLNGYDNYVNLNNYRNSNSNANTSSIMYLKQFDEILIYVHDEFKSNDGGVVVQYYMGKLLDQFGVKTRIYSCKKNKYNPIFNNHYSGDFNLDKTAVIYCEGIIGNPLGAKYVVRWLLSELGKNVSEKMYLTWGKNELVYYFNREKKFDTERLKINIIYKELPLLYINPILLSQNKNFLNFDERNDYCFTMRKYQAYHKEIKNIHSLNSVEIIRETIFLDAINIFLKHKYFVSYDPLTFYQIVSVLCGCICIVYPLEGVSKIEWLKQTALWSFMEACNTFDLYGIAYGQEETELQWAKSTINMAQKQWFDIINYHKNESIQKLITDLNNFDKLLNTVENNFYISK